MRADPEQQQEEENTEMKKPLTTAKPIDNATDKRRTLQGEAVNPTDFAAFLGISRPTLYRWLNAGMLPQPSIRRGRVVRWSRTVVENCLTGRSE